MSGLSCGHQDNRTTAEQHQQVVKHSASHLFSSSRFLHRFCCAYSLLPLARLDTLFVRSAFCSLAIQVALACPTCSCSCSFESSLRPLPCPPCIFCALKGTINYQSVGDQHIAGHCERWSNPATDRQSGSRVLDLEAADAVGSDS